MTTTASLLEVNDIRASFGGVRALDGASFSVTRSSVEVGSVSPQSQNSQPTLQRQGRGFRRNGLGMQVFPKGTSMIKRREISHYTGRHVRRSERERKSAGSLRSE